MEINDNVSGTVSIPLVSVIVPIYNVEKYVRKCLESLKGQTLREIEVICIDDGSTDGSGRIADEYKSNKYPIFRVIHTENRGLSAARNRGIDEAKAEWLMFVDSDDWVSKDFCKIPFENAVENKADLVIFNGYDVGRKGKLSLQLSSDTPIGYIDAFTAHGYGGVAVWNKLYNRSVFRSIRYPNGRLYEDKATTHKVVNVSKRIIMLETPLYYHINRKDSITHDYSEHNRKDCFISNLERYNDLVKYGYVVENEKLQLCSSALGFLAYSGQKEDELHKIAETIVESVIRSPISFPNWKKIVLLLWKVEKRSFYYICSIARRARKLKKFLS